MLVVRVEVWPSGDEQRSFEIGRIGLANTTGLKPHSDYTGVVARQGEEPHAVRVLGHHRAAGWLPLVREALAAEGLSVHDVKDALEVLELLDPSGDFM